MSLRSKYADLFKHTTVESSKKRGRPRKNKFALDANASPSITATVLTPGEPSHKRQYTFAVPTKATLTYTVGGDDLQDAFNNFLSERVTEEVSIESVCDWSGCVEDLVVHEIYGNSFRQVELNELIAMEAKLKAHN